MRHARAAVTAAVILAAVLVPVRAAAQAGAAGPEVLGFTKHFAVEITNPSPLTLENQAIVIEVADIRATVAPDFNTYMYALFDAGGEYGLVVSQADDLDQDRYHDQIVFVRTLPPSSTTRILCYWTPARSLPRFITTEKAFARRGWEPGGAEAGWESKLAGYEFVHGAIGVFGKLQPGLILRGLPAGLAKREWGERVLEPGHTAGAGGLSLWDGAKRVKLFDFGFPQVKLTVISPGPVRGLVKAEYSAVKTAAGDVAVTVFYSAFAENIYSRQDVVLTAKAGSSIVLGPGLEHLGVEAWSFDKAKGILTTYGVLSRGAFGLAAIFSPSDALGIDKDSALERTVKLSAQPGRKLTYWVAAAWQRGVTNAEAYSAQSWAVYAGDLAARLLVPVKVEFRSK